MKRTAVRVTVILLEGPADELPDLAAIVTRGIGGTALASMVEPTDDGAAFPDDDDDDDGSARVAAAVSARWAEIQAEQEAAAAAAAAAPPSKSRKVKRDG